MNKIVFSCSGCSDLGHISDLLARRFRDNGVSNTQDILDEIFFKIENL